MRSREAHSSTLAYRVYWNAGGGSIDYSIPIATTSEFSLEVGPLAVPGDYVFGVRTLDPLTGLEEVNTNVVVHVILDADGIDRSGRPEPPRFVEVIPTPDGGGRVVWVNVVSEISRVPREFRVILGRVGESAIEAARVPYSAGRLGHAARIAGPLTRGTYWVEVVAVGQAGESLPSERATALLGVSSEPFAMEPVAVRLI